MSKKVPVVKITTPDAAGELAGVPLEATVAMADVAAAMKEGLLAFSTAAGLEEALAQLGKAGFPAGADTEGGYRAYAGIADSREGAEALAASFGGVELYIRPLDIPAVAPEAFAAQHGAGPAMVNLVRRRLVGKRRQPRSAWLDEDPNALIVAAYAYVAYRVRREPSR